MPVDFPEVLGDFKISSKTFTEEIWQAFAYSEGDGVPFHIA